MNFKEIKIILIAAGIAVLFVQCDKENPIVTDVQQTAALKNVTVEYNDMAYEITLPEGALSGMPLDSLLAIDSSKYANPANYSISFITNLKADNTKDNAKDAEFDGMFLDVIMDTIESSPIRTEADAFLVKKDSVKPVEAIGSINLATHRRTGIYIFRQTVEGEDLATTMSPVLKYTIGLQEGEINIPDFKQDIPTRASDETKAFLSELLNSGLLDEEQ